MALDVYAGPLTRYFMREWENVGQRQSREQGLRYTQIGPDGDVSKLPKPSLAEVLEGLDAWRAALNRDLGGHITEPIAWDDSMSTPYLTDRPGYGAYAGLVLWAAYADRPDLTVPATPPQEWYSDPVFQAASEKGSGTHYRQILQPEIWFPSEFDFAFKYATPVVDEAWLGSSRALLRQLDALNAITFRASEADLALFTTGDFDAATEMEHAAKVGFAIFRALA